MFIDAPSTFSGNTARFDPRLRLAALFPLPAPSRWRAAQKLLTRCRALRAKKKRLLRPPCFLMLAPSPAGRKRWPHPRHRVASAVESVTRVKPERLFFRRALQKRDVKDRAREGRDGERARRALARRKQEHVARRVSSSCAPRLRVTFSALGARCHANARRFWPLVNRAAAQNARFCVHTSQVPVSRGRAVKQTNRPTFANEASVNHERTREWVPLGRHTFSFL